MTLLFVLAAGLANNAPPPTIDAATLQPPSLQVAVKPNSTSQGPVPLGNPGYWVMTNDYPSEALREEAQGTSRFKLEVNESGQVTNCIITVGSGNSALDEATCRLASQRAKFRAARDALGRAVTGTYSNAVVWAIPKTDPIPEPSSAERVFDILPDGSTNNCAVVSVSGAASTKYKVGPVPCPKTYDFIAPVDAAGKAHTKRVTESFQITVTDIN